MAYIGREPQTGNYQICDAISVVDGQAAYTMQVSSTNVIPESVNHMIVSLNGVIQKPGSSYTIASSTITFSSNLATGDSIDFIYLLGNVLDLGTPSDSTVTTAKLSGNLVTPGTLDVNGQELILDADADTSITADTDDQIDIKVAGADDFQITANTLTALSGSTIKADTIAETTSANGVAVDGLTIKDGKLNTNDSVVTANITDANVTSAKIAGDAITAAKIADDAISEEHLDATVITGMTELAAEPADTDEFLISDAGTLKRIDYSHIKGGGSWVLVDTQTVSGTPSSVESGAVFSSTYDTYVIVIRRVNFSANGGFQMQIGDSSAYVTSGYRWAGSGVNSGGGLVTYSASDSQIDLLGGTGSSYHMNTTQDCLSGVIWVHNPYNSVRTSIHGELAWENASDVDAHINNIAAHPNTGASYDRWKLFPNTGTFQTTTIIQTFGVVNA